MTMPDIRSIIVLFLRGHSEDAEQALIQLISQRESTSNNQILWRMEQDEQIDLN